MDTPKRRGRPPKYKPAEQKEQSPHDISQAPADPEGQNERLAELGRKRREMMRRADFLNGRY